jgi:hypothetical protein
LDTYEYNGRLAEITTISAFVQLRKIGSLKMRNVDRLYLDVFSTNGCRLSCRQMNRMGAGFKIRDLQVVKIFTGFEQRHVKNEAGFYWNAQRK